MTDGFKEKIQKQVLETTVKAVEEKIAVLVCPVHGQKPRMKFSEGSGPGEQKMAFDCCCDTLAKMLQEVLKD